MGGGKGSNLKVKDIMQEVFSALRDLRPQASLDLMSLFTLTKIEKGAVRSMMYLPWYCLLRVLFISAKRFHWHSQWKKKKKLKNKWIILVLKFKVWFFSMPFLPKSFEKRKNSFSFCILLRKSIIYFALLALLSGKLREWVWC